MNKNKLSSQGKNLVKSPNFENSLIARFPFIFIKLSKNIVNSIKLEIILVKEIRQSYNPVHFFLNIKQAYQKRQILYLINQTIFCFINAFIYSFLPIWFAIIPIRFLINFKIWRLTFSKLNFSIQEYRTWTKNSIVNSCKQTINFKIGLSFFPFLFGISEMILSRYQDQTFSYFIQKNLPGISLSPQKLSWETFQYITSKNLNLKESNLINSKHDSKKRSEFLLNLEDSSWPSVSKSISFLKRMDFYNDSLLLEVNSNWDKYQSELFLGTSPKKQYINDELFFKNQESNNFKNADLALLVQSPDQKNPLTDQNKFKESSNKNIENFSSAKKDTSLLSNELSSSSRFSYKNSSFSNFSTFIGNNWYTIFSKNWNSTNLHKTPKFFLDKTYWKYFYLNFDELPSKLNQSCASLNTNFIRKKLSLKNNNLNRQDLIKASSLVNKNLLDPAIAESQIFIPEQKKLVYFSRENSKIVPTVKNKKSSLFWSKTMNALGFSPKQTFSTVKEGKLKIKFINLKFNNLDDLIAISKKNEEEKKVFLNCFSSFLQNFYLSRKSLNIFSKFLLETSKTTAIPNNSSLIKIVQKQKPVRDISSFKLILNTDNNKKFLFLQNELKDFFYSKRVTPPTNLNFSKLESEVIGTILEFSNQKNPTDLQEIHRFLLNLKEQNKMNFSEYCSKEILQTLNNSLLKKNNLIQPRIMSGYYFPDISDKELKSLVLQIFYKKNFLDRLYFSQKKLSNRISPLGRELYSSQNFLSSIKIQLPQSFVPGRVSEIKYNFPFLKQPNLNIKYRPTFLEGITQTLYEGPGVVQNSFTKEVEIKNKTQVRNWLKNFFSPDNPLTDRRDGFFGKNKDSDTTFSENVFRRGSETAEFLEKAESRRGSSNENLPVVPYYDEFQVPYLNEKEWGIILEKIKADLEEKSALDPNFDLDKFHLSIPLIRIRTPKNGPIVWPLTQIDYQPPLLNYRGSRGKEEDPSSNSFACFSCFDSKKVKQRQLYSSQSLEVFKNSENGIPLKFHYIPSSQILLNRNLVEKKFFGGIYQKIFSTYNSMSTDHSKQTLAKNLSVQFRECWEPITKNSWLILTQFSFGFFVLRILRDFYKKYGRELLSYLLDLVASLGISVEIDENLKDELQLNENEKGFRLIRKVQKRFNNIAGIDNILPELGEIVWFLRNSGRSFKVGNSIPKGILLIGPPGTGKTLLVQAIAGEAEVPVLIQSGSSLNDPEQEEVGAERLKNIFEQARQIAPCILFIDEIDTLGEKRENVIQNPMGTDELIESLQQTNQKLLKNLDPNGVFMQEHSMGSRSNDEMADLIPKPKIEINLEQDEQQISEEINIVQQNVDSQEARQEQLSLLMQFLVELDGLQSRKGVLVIGATNRPNVLDPALTRPGRFDKILDLDLPNQKKRIEILKLYSKNLGVDKSISWNYLANRTIGFSAADLAAAMNESSMKAILKETIHTITTIEDGIESITSYSNEKPEVDKKNSSDPFFTSRLAYYQAGKAILHTLLSYHPPAVVLHLWPNRKNARYASISNVLQKEFLGINRRVELESRIIGLYAGKAAEFLVLCQYSTRLFESTNNLKKMMFWQSDLGLEELNFASSLAYSMIDKWYFYSKNIATRKLNKIFINRNLQEFQETEIFDLFKQIAYENELGINNEIKSSSFQGHFQQWVIRPWWQTQVINETGILNPAYDDWYRIYLPNSEENERNEEWVPPDQYYHNNDSLTNLVLNAKFLQPKNQVVPSRKDSKTPTSSINLNDLYEIDRDYIYHSLVLTCFNKAFSILDQNRELLDYISSYLMRYEIIRQDEIINIISQFETKKINSREILKEPTSKNLFLQSKNMKISDSKKSEPKQELKGKKEIKDFSIKVIEKSWGKKSKRILPRFIDFEFLIE